MKKRFKKIEKKQKSIMESNDPAAIARHLLIVLNDQGYSTKSWDNIPNFHNIDIRIHGGFEEPLAIENMAQKWEIKEVIPEPKEEPAPEPIKWEPKHEDDLPF